jgi:hypothetical protein
MKMFSIFLILISVQTTLSFKLLAQNSDLILTSDTAEVSLQKVTIFKPTIENLLSVEQQVTSVSLGSIDNIPNFDPKDFWISPSIITLSKNGEAGSKKVIEVIFTPSSNYPESCLQLRVKTTFSEATTLLCIKKTTGIEDENLSITDYSISPNPASDFITISLPNYTHTVKSVVENGQEKVQIFNTLGIEVLSELIHPITSSHQMNIESLPTGVYFIKIGDRVEKFVKF